MDTRSDPRQRSMAVHGATTTHGSPHPFASAENFKSQVCFHYFTLLTIVFLSLCPGRGTAVATHFARFFFNDGGHVMINVLCNNGRCLSSLENYNLYGLVTSLDGRSVAIHEGPQLPSLI